MKLGIIYSDYYTDIWSAQKEQVVEYAQEKNIEVDFHWIPGSLEAPYMAAKLIADNKYDGLAVLGCVVEGETYHNHIIQETAHFGLMQLSVAKLIPIGMGILTVKNYEQAKKRASKEKPYARHAIAAVYEILTRS